MTYEEAIEFTDINVDIRCSECIYFGESKCNETVLCTEWKKLVIEALEKQIPKKPRRTDAYPHRLYCAKCSWTFFFNENNKIKDMFRFCPECGQAVDWSDEEPGARFCATDEIVRHMLKRSDE